MRVLHVNKFLYRRGGAEAYVLDLADLQRAAGHEVALFGMQHPENPPLPYAHHFPPHVELEPPPPALRHRATAFGRMMYSPSSRRGIAAVLRSFRPDVVHLHNIYHQLSPSILGAVRDHGAPAVMTLHDYKLACPSYLMLDHGRPCDACLGGSFLPAVRRRCKDGSIAASAVLAVESTVHRAMGAYDAVGTFLCPSRFLTETMVRAGIYPDRLQTVPSFVDSQAVAVKTEPGGSVVFVGRLSAEKGVDVLIRALALLPTATLDIAGEGPERAALNALAATCAPGRVRFHGRLPRDEVLRLVRSAAVLALPSRCLENQPISVLEAFACAVPAVSSDLGGLPELMGQGRRGVTVPAGETEPLADALRLLLEEPEWAFELGRAARKYVEEEFAPERHLRRLDAVYPAPARVGAPAH